MLSERRNMDDDRDSCGTVVVIVSLQKGDTVEANCGNKRSYAENSNLFSGILMENVNK